MKILIFLSTLFLQAYGAEYCGLFFQDFKSQSDKPIEHLRTLIKDHFKQAPKKQFAIPRVSGQRVFNTETKKPLIAGYVEFPVSMITYIHPIPNPYEVDDSAKEAELMKRSIQKFGFFLDNAINLVFMPDGQFISTTGHKRIKAMIDLNETTVPATIEFYQHLSHYEKIAIDSMLDFYRNEIPEFDGSFNDFAK